ncbi:MAG: type II toxin-antitoxin system RelE/ParE family toxin [Methanospirillum sp.]
MRCPRDRGQGGDNLPHESPPYTVVWTGNAMRMLGKLPEDLQVRILDQVDGCAENPYAHSLKVEGTPYHRLRVGDYRVLMQISASILTVEVVRVSHRKKAYRGL